MSGSRRRLAAAVAACGMLLAFSACGHASNDADAAVAAPNPKPASEEAMQEPDGITCEIAVDDADLPNRGAARVARDVEAAGAEAHHLKGESPRGRRPKTPAFTTRELHDALDGGPEARARSAAFLAGRCRAGDAAADERLTARVRTAMTEHADAGTRVEAAMAVALRDAGGREAAAKALRAALAETGEPWVAAGYLAQLGDASGWPALRRALGAETITAYRTAAARALLDFVGLRGREVEGAEVDAWAALGALAADEEAAVRQVVPPLLVEAGHPDTRALLEQLAQDEHASVKLLAEHALKGLDAD